MSWARLVEFGFVVAVPVVLVAGGLVTLFAVGALFDMLEHPEELRRGVERLFQREPESPRQPSRRHYYRPHWSVR